MDKLFGTDGVRGKSNVFPLTPRDIILLAYSIVLAMEQELNATIKSILIAKDTRISSYMLEYAITSAFSSMGKNICLVGVAPTPTLSFLTNSMPFDLGVMISASHNNYQDNGIKVYDLHGEKISKNIEQKIEKIFFNFVASPTLEKELPLVSTHKLGMVSNIKNSTERYISYIKNMLDKNNSLPFKGVKLVVDCANGASFSIAPKLFQELGADVIKINDSPNGININLNSGSTHLEMLIIEVIKNEADLGIAFDGDADRVLMIDNNGNVIPGEIILAFLIEQLAQENNIAEPTLVVSEISNYALDDYLLTKKIKTVRVPVGDYNVSLALNKYAGIIGGEPSGHIIIRDKSIGSDGILSSILFLNYLLKNKLSSSLCNNLFKLYPNTLYNLRYVKENPLKNKYLVEKLNNIKDKHKDTSYIVIRESGTEQLIRIYIECHDPDIIQPILQEIIKTMSICE